jgi:hypothetical protein
LGGDKAATDIADAVDEFLCIFDPFCGYNTEQQLGGGECALPGVPDLAAFEK